MRVLSPNCLPLVMRVPGTAKRPMTFEQANLGNIDFHDADSLRAPDAAEWQQFAQSLELRDMGTHLCALPAGEHCARGLVCLGCSSAQPKKSAAPIFRRMLRSHENALDRAREREPAGQLAARELEVPRIVGALRRADALDDVAAGDRSRLLKAPASEEMYTFVLRCWA